MLLGLVAAVLVAQFNRVVGGIIALLILSGILAWGLRIFHRGEAVGLLGATLSERTFVLILGALIALNLWGVVIGVIRGRKRGRGGEDEEGEG